jgi:hypothetical protein
LVWPVNATRTEVPRGARAAHRLAGSTDLFEVVGIVARGTITHTLEVEVVIPETRHCILSTGIALIVLGTEASETLFVTRHTLAIDDELTLLALGDTEGLSSVVTVCADCTLVRPRA